MADNVDHNLVTLTGKGTFHGMGVISISTCDIVNDLPVRRLKEKQKASTFSANKGIPIVNYDGRSVNGLLRLKFKSIEHLAMVQTHPTELSYNSLWQCSWFFQSSCTNWSGFMQSITCNINDGIHRKDRISFLPIIDLNPSDENCIYSTLLFVCEEAKKLKIGVPSVTFDQPLWLKASGIIKEAQLDIVCRLGGFHTMMSFLGSIGQLMKGSGLETLFGEVYAEHTVVHLMSGKAISRALRAHFLTEAALMTLLLEMIFDTEMIDDIVFKTQLNELNELNDSDSQLQVDTFLESDIFRAFEEALLNLKNNLSKTYRTAKLWISYLHYVHILKSFILAERTSNWALHVESTLNMLNLFAASGHISYAKSARFYVQQMQDLHITQPWLHQQFMNGLHAVRRSDRYWSGLWSDLTIEQTLMRSIKTRVGLTRGRGMSESVRHLWVLSLSHCAGVHDAMMDLSGLTVKTSEQHTDASEPRRKRDLEDFTRFKNWLKERNPFTFTNTNLQSLSA